MGLSLRVCLLGWLGLGLRLGLGLGLGFGFWVRRPNPWTENTRCNGYPLLQVLLVRRLSSLWFFFWFFWGHTYTRGEEGER